MGLLSTSKVFNIHNYLIDIIQSHTTKWILASLLSNGLIDNKVIIGVMDGIIGDILDIYGLGIKVFGRDLVNYILDIFMQILD